MSYSIFSLVTCFMQAGVLVHLLVDLWKLENKTSVMEDAWIWMSLSEVLHLRPLTLLGSVIQKSHGCNKNFKSTYQMTFLTCGFKITWFPRLLGDVLHLIRSGKVNVIRPIKIFDVSEIEQAFRYFSQGSRVGKVVVSMQNKSSLIPVSFCKDFSLEILLNNQYSFYAVNLIHFLTHPNII